MRVVKAFEGWQRLPPEGIFASIDIAEAEARSSFPLA
jgi:hypothetical protein